MRGDIYMAVDTLVSSSKLVNIADTIRKYGDTDDTYTLDEMPQAIADIVEGGGGGGFDWSKVVNTQYMFRQSSASTLDISGMDGVNANNMSYMFNNCIATSIAGLGVLDAQSFGSLHINASSMFYGATLLTSADFTGAVWNDSLTTWGGVNMENMFLSASNVQSITLPDISNAGSFVYLNSFANSCTYLTSLDFSTITNTNASSSATISGMCYGCTRLNHVIMPSVDSYSGWSSAASAPFADCSRLAYILVPASPHDTVITLPNGYLFGASGANSRGTKIVVPDDMVADYKADTNWSLFADYIVGESEYFDE